MGVGKPLGRLISLGVLASLIAGCSTMTPQAPSSAHLRGDRIPEVTPQDAVPPPVDGLVSLPKPRSTPKAETYSVVVNNVRAQDLLFALARDARVNVDIHPGINGTVTLNAIDQTLQQLLTRISKQVDMRWELDGPNLIVTPDTPYLHSYRVDYVNMSRDTTGTVTVTTQIAATGSSPTGTASGGTTGGNNSLTRIENKAQNRFWATLEANIKDMLRETDKILPEGSSETVIERSEHQNTTGTGAQTLGATSRQSGAATSLAGSPNPASLQQEGATVVKRTTFREAASVIVNPESGVISVRATSRQHEKIQEFLDQIMSSARRQVLIEATIAEVQLTDSYQQGIDWSAIHLGRAGFTVKQTVGGTLAAPAASLLELGYTNTNSRVGNISATVKLLESFGTVKVLSSPKLSVLNNQSAVLKVIDNQVYFTIKADTTQNQTSTVTTYTTTLNSVPVGFVMNVTPQISENDTVILNVRPSISRVIGTVDDPNPALQAAGVTSKIPVIRTREMESMIRVDSGNIAVMGGLMEDTLQNQDDTIPGLARIPGLGNFFQNKDNTRRKTELIVFLRPVVLRDASINGDFRNLKDRLPNEDFFNPGNRTSQGRDSGGKTP